MRPPTDNSFYEAIAVMAITYGAFWILGLTLHAFFVR